jgi:hypothetical protein
MPCLHNTTAHLLYVTGVDEAAVDEEIRSWGRALQEELSPGDRPGRGEAPPRPQP